MDLTDFGRFLRILRINKRQKTADMAKVLGYSRSHLSLVERGRTKVSDKFLKHLLENYKMTPGAKERLMSAAQEQNERIQIKRDAEERTDIN